MMHLKAAQITIPSLALLLTGVIALPQHRDFPTLQIRNESLTNVSTSSNGDPLGWNIKALSALPKIDSARAQLSILKSAYPSHGIFIVHDEPRLVPTSNVVFSRKVNSLDPGIIWDSTYLWNTYVVSSGTFTFKKLYNQDFLLGGRFYQYQDEITFLPVAKQNIVVNTTSWMANIDDQLAKGIRFFDLRVGSASDPLKLRHGMLELEGRAGDVFKNFQDFLAAHPSETVLCSIKWDYDGSGQPSDFESLLESLFNDGNHGNWYTSTTLPKLDDARGKIVLLRRYSGNLGFYMDVSNNTPDHTDSTGQFRVQDLYSPSTLPNGTPNYNRKWNVVENFLNTHQSFNSSQLSLNFLSAVNIEGINVIYKPAVWANEINARMQTWLDTIESQTANLGIVAMDFPDVPGGDWSFSIKQMMAESGQTLLHVSGQVKLIERLILTNFA
ncbi:hypothetical protein EYR41_011219 [Orbilia oligospora]|uniref:Phosphatidylinositol-specific phospholipase C X domain-containing protein n=1 Tax=Orbilia oligospora TaxID=2813651 RepID=A0A8H2HLC3_ORBOL|nr:hypothetical protein TWF128_005958 [Orbilia oligospora]TGJ63286.1 hypothetical protein EYR41_011219 [Orbilia oligospora]